jgi:hypothetical protein
MTRSVPIPETFIKGKDKVTIKFQAHRNSWVDNIFGLKTLKKASTNSQAGNRDLFDYEMSKQSGINR